MRGFWETAFLAMVVFIPSMLVLLFVADALGMNRGFVNGVAFLIGISSGIWANTRA